MNAKLTGDRTRMRAMTANKHTTTPTDAPGWLFYFGQMYHALGRAHAIGFDRVTALGYGPTDIARSAYWRAMLRNRRDVEWRDCRPEWRAQWLDWFKMGVRASLENQRTYARQ